MQNNTSFSKDPNPDLTQTIHAIVNQKPTNLNEASSPEAIVSKYNKMKDADDPNEAAMLLANFLQNKKAIKCLLLAKQIRELEKTMPEEIKDRKTDGFNVVDILKYTARWRSYLWRDFEIKYPQVKKGMA